MNPINLSVLEQTILGSFLTTFTGNVAMVKDEVLSFIGPKVPRIAEIAAGVINGTIPAAEAKIMMQDELTITETEFISIEVQEKQAVQDAINTAIATVSAVINQFIPATSATTPTA